MIQGTGFNTRCCGVGNGKLCPPFVWNVSKDAATFLHNWLMVVVANWTGMYFFNNFSILDRGKLLRSFHVNVSVHSHSIPITDTRDFVQVPILMFWIRNQTMKRRHHLFFYQFGRDPVPNSNGYIVRLLLSFFSLTSLHRTTYDDV